MENLEQEAIDKLKNIIWDLEASPKAVEGLKLIIEAAELQSNWGRCVHQTLLDTLTSTEPGEGNEWYIEIKLSKKEDNHNDRFRTLDQTKVTIFTSD